VVHLQVNVLQLCPGLEVFEDTEMSAAVQSESHAAIKVREFPGITFQKTGHFTLKTAPLCSSSIRPDCTESTLGFLSTLVFFLAKLAGLVPIGICSAPLYSPLDVNQGRPAIKAGQQSRQASNQGRPVIKAGQ